MSMNHNTTTHQEANPEIPGFPSLLASLARVHTHPGKILLHDYMMPLCLTVAELSRALDVPPNRIADIIACRRRMTPDTALRLARYFDTTPQYWLRLQMMHDLSAVYVQSSEEIARRVKPRKR